MLLYEIRRKVSARELRARRKLAPVRCCQNEGAQPRKQAGMASTVPWFEGERPTRSSTILRVPGQKRSAQRAIRRPHVAGAVERRAQLVLGDAQRRARVVERRERPVCGPRRSDCESQSR